ncbi:hypothetical protein SNK03_003474 [Fusarium graminearum]
MGFLAELILLLDLLHFWIKLIFPTASYILHAGMPVCRYIHKWMDKISPIALRQLNLISICIHKDMDATLYKICSEASSIIVISESNAWSSVLVPVLQPTGQAVHEPSF